MAQKTLWVTHDPLRQMNSLNDSRVLLELHKTWCLSCACKPGHQQYFTSLFARLTNHNQNRPKVFNFRDDLDSLTQYRLSLWSITRIGAATSIGRFDWSQKFVRWFWYTIVRLLLFLGMDYCKLFVSFSFSNIPGTTPPERWCYLGIFMPCLLNHAVTIPMTCGDHKHAWRHQSCYRDLFLWSQDHIIMILYPEWYFRTAWQSIWTSLTDAASCTHLLKSSRKSDTNL